MMPELPPFLVATLPSNDPALVDAVRDFIRVNSNVSMEVTFHPLGDGHYRVGVPARTYSRTKEMLQQAVRGFIVGYLYAQRGKTSPGPAPAIGSLVLTIPITPEIDVLSAELYGGDKCMCHSGQDGDCGWKHCPQIRDKEPETTGRHCPLDIVYRGEEW